MLISTKWPEVVTDIGITFSIQFLSKTLARYKEQSLCIKHGWHKSDVVVKYWQNHRSRIDPLRASNPACRAFTWYAHVAEDPSNISCSRDTWTGGGRISNGAEGQSRRFEISDHPDYVRHNEINCQSQFPPLPFYRHRVDAHPSARDETEREGGPHAVQHQRRKPGHPPEKRQL